MKIEIGSINQLTLGEKKADGWSIKDSEVFMPNFLSEGKLSSGDQVKAFVYLDPDLGPTASMIIPEAVVGEYGFMRVVGTREFGAFFDWGLEKDLLVPGNEQKEKVQPGEAHIVRVCLEADTNRVFGTTKLGKFIENTEFDIKEKQKVSIIAANKTELGYRVIINKKYIGMIYHNEIFKTIYPGEEYTAVVKKLREDGLVDVALQVQGIKNLEQAKDEILKELKRAKGSIALHDKSSPDAIKNALGMSKKTFKSAIGMLYKERHISIYNDRIELNKE